MGGSVGDQSPFLDQNSATSNHFGQQQPPPQQQPPYPPQQQQQPTSNVSYGNPPSTPEHRVGSVTQYASPEMGGSMMQQQPPQQPGMGMPSQPNMQSSWQSGMSGQPQQQQFGQGSMMQPQMQQPQVAAAGGGHSWQNQSQMLQPSHYYQQQQGNVQGQMQQPQPQPPGPQYRSYSSGGASVGSQQQSAPTAGSYAARSAQAYAHIPHQQQQQQQQQQPPSQMMHNNMMQQPQYQHQQMMQGGSMQGSGMMQQPSGGQPQFQAQQQFQPQQPQAQMQNSMMQQPQFQQQQQQPQQHPPQQPGGSQYPPPQQPQSQASTMGYPHPNQSVAGATMATGTPGKPQPSWAETPAQIAIQNRLLTDATRKVQEHAYYMKQAMEKNDLPTVLDRASLMVGQLGEIHGPSHHPQTAGPHAPPPGGEASQLNPKNYYELHMRALEDMPHFEEYLLQISGYSQQNQPVDPTRITITMAPTPGPGEAKFTMRELYDCVQYCPQVLPRLYLQICAGSALIQSGEVGTKWVMDDLMQATKCVQNPVRGLFLRHYLLQMVRDKLPDSPVESTPLAGEAPAAAAPNDSASAATGEVGGSADGSAALPQQAAQSSNPEQEKGTVVDSYKFILANFIEMNKLWVRIQHLPGDLKSKDQRKRRERERNELRVLVGTNLVRLSQLEGVTSKIYGEVILPTVLDHIVVCGDPLAQAYLIDCITQVFPDEYHIETLPILLRVCPKLRDKVNIRTILQSLMDRLANYLADEELLDETDTNQVKKNMAQDSFPMFEECVQNVYNARGPKLTAKEVVRLQTALLSFSLRCFKGDMDQVNRCLQGCVVGIKQANASYEMQEGMMGDGSGGMKPLDEVATVELEKLLSIPLDSLALKVLQLDNYGELISFLPWQNRRGVALQLLKAVENAGAPPKSVKEIQELFGMVEPVIRDEFETPAHYGSADDASVAMSQLSMSGMSSYGQPQSMGFNQSPHMAPPSKEVQTENALVSKLVHLLDHEDTDIVYEMLVVARQHINAGGKNRVGQTLVAVVFAAFRLTERVFDAEYGINDEEKKSDDAGKEFEDSKGDSAGEKMEEGESKESEEKGPEEDGETKEGEEEAKEGEETATEAKEGEETAKEADAPKEEPESTSPESDLKDDINGGEAGEASAAKTVT